MIIAVLFCSRVLFSSEMNENNFRIILTNESYEILRNDIFCDHILFKQKKQRSPEDCLAILKKMLNNKPKPFCYNVLESLYKQLFLRDLTLKHNAFNKSEMI